MKLTGITIATFVAAGALLAGGGVALAGQGHGQGTAADGDRCQRFLARIAEKQGISVAQLEAKWKQKAIEHINAALDAGPAHGRAGQEAQGARRGVEALRRKPHEGRREGTPGRARTRRSVGVDDRGRDAITST